MTQSMCIALDPNCADCARRANRRHCKSVGCDELCSMLCELLSTEDGHAAVHKAERCSKCGTPTWNEDGSPNDVRRLCRNGCCTDWHCPGCGRLLGSDGPVNCGCQSTWWSRAVWWLPTRVVDLYYWVTDREARRG